MLTAISLTALAVYMPTWGYPFVHDDVPIVMRNPAVVESGPWHSVLTAPYWPPKYPGDPLYRPLTLLSLRWDHALWGETPRGYRITGSLFHALVSIATALLAASIWRHRLAGWAAGLGFAVHPVHAETLGLVVGRSELLAGLFVTLLLWRHWVFMHKQGSGFPDGIGIQGSGWGGPSPSDLGESIYYAVHHLTCAVLFFLAICSKEHSVFALVGVMAMDIVGRDSGSGESLRVRLRRLAASHYLGMVFALALYLTMRWSVFGWRSVLPKEMIDPFFNPLVNADWTARLLTPFALLWLSLELCFVPLKLCPIWSIGGFDLPTTFWRWDVLGGLIAGLALLILGLWGLRKKHPLGWLCPSLLSVFLIPCHALPAANWLFAERWLYLPSVLLAVMGAGLLKRLPRPFTIATMGFVTVALAYLTLDYQRCWRSNEALFTATVERHPRSYHALVGLAAVNHERGTLNDVPHILERLVRFHPQSPSTWYYEALRTGHLGKYKEALEAIDRYARLTLGSPLPRDLSELQQSAQRAADEPE